MPNKEPLSRIQRRILLLSLGIIVLISLLIFLFSGPGSPRVQEPTATPEPTFASVIESRDTLPTPTPTPSPVPTPTPIPTPTPSPSPLPVPESFTTLRKSDKGEAVVALQRKLIELGYLEQGSNDGDFGSGTEAAVKEFQTNNGLEADGIAGNATQTRLYSMDAVPKR